MQVQRATRFYAWCLLKFPQDCPPFQGLSEYVQLVAGAALTAAEVLRQSKAEVAICWDGGRSLTTFKLSLSFFDVSTL